MVGFIFRRFWLHRSQIMNRRLRAMRVRLGRMRRVNRRERRTLEAWQVTAAQIEVRNWRIMGENELQFLANYLADRWVRERLVELENDPLIRNELERNNGRSIVAGNQAHPFQDDGRRL
ncbi:hypothetical protein DITRI_Ditri20bG0053200 [Diplodiscus trichospermus]